MQKSKVILLIFMLLLIMTGCNSKEHMEEEVFQQGNIMNLYGPVMETDLAYYYTSNDMKYELHYYDKASEQSIFLCNKPECNHDGNEFCAATAGGRYVMYSTLYGDGIYIAALEREDNRIDKKLLKISLDGTEIETICTFGSDPASDIITIGTSEDKYMAIYMGMAFIPYVTPQKDGTNNYGTAIVNIASGKVEYLEECNSRTALGQQKYIPYEDYLYYYVSAMGDNTRTLYRYHLSEKTNEEISVPKNFTDYCIVDGMIVYTQADENGYVHIYSYNQETSETKDLTGPLKGEDGMPLLREWEGELLFDGDYLIIPKEPSELDSPFQYHVFSKEGTLLTSFTSPDDVEYGADISILNGYVYFRDYYCMVRCSMQDILNGDERWTTLFISATEEAE